MELRQLRYFLVLAEQLNFTRAAERLHIVQSALSKQIRLLEEEIGVKLLERTNRQVDLTPAGRIFRQRAEVALKQAASAVMAARKIQLSEGGQLRMGFYGTIAWSILPRLLMKFYAELPNISIKLMMIEAAQQIGALMDEKIDMGFSTIVSNDGQLEFRLISSKPQIAAIPSGHPAARHEELDLKWFSEDRFIIPPSKNPHGTREQILEACLEAGFMPRTEQTIPAAESAVCLVASGLGIAIVPEWHQNMQVKGVVFRPFKKPLFKIDYFAVRRKGDTLPLLQRMWDGLDTLGDL